jgi:hypothetical protein
MPNNSSILFTYSSILSKFSSMALSLSSSFSTLAFISLTLLNPCIATQMNLNYSSSDGLTWLSGSATWYGAPTGAGPDDNGKNIIIILHIFIYTSMNRVPKNIGFFIASRLFSYIVFLWKKLFFQLNLCEFACITFLLYIYIYIYFCERKMRV